MPNVTNTICLIFGMSAFARLPAMLNNTAGSGGIQNACTVAKIDTIISSCEFITVAKLEAVIDGLNNVKVFYLEDLRAKFTWLDKTWLMGFAVWLPRLATKKSKTTDPAVVLFT